MGHISAEIKTAAHLSVPWKKRFKILFLLFFSIAEMRVYGNLEGLRASMLSPITQQNESFCLWFKYELGDKIRSSELKVYQLIGHLGGLRKLIFSKTGES